MEAFFTWMKRVYLRHIALWRLERDADFRATLDKFAWGGMRLAGVFAILGVALFILAHLIAGSRLYWSFSGIDPAPRVVLWNKALFVGLGTLLLLAAKVRLRLGPSRLLMALFLLVTALALVWEDVQEGDLMFTAAWLTLVMLFAVGTVPFQPLQSVGLCLGIMASYVFFVDYASMASAGVPLDHLAYLGLVGLLCSAMSSALYESRYAQYRSKRKIEQMQDQLVQKEKLASLGHWTAGIAHEIKNPLNFVNNFAKLSIDIADELDEELAATPEHSIAEDGSEIHGLIEILKTNARKILEHGQRADRIVHGMLLHARGAQGTREPTDLNGLLRLAAEAAEDGFRSQYPDAAFNLEIHLDPSITNVPVVAESIIQVVINLLDNAFYASVQSGAGGDGAPPLVELRTRSLARAIEVRVTDSGIGMDAKAMSSVFDPFFTTKPPGEGTGLGLSLSYDIVTKEHGGTLTVESEEGRGATFVVTLPIGKHTAAQT